MPLVYLKLMGDTANEGCRIQHCNNRIAKSMLGERLEVLRLDWQLFSQNRWIFDH
jgi:hypothetical protein